MYPRDNPLTLKPSCEELEPPANPAWFKPFASATAWCLVFKPQRGFNIVHSPPPDLYLVELGRFTGC